MSTMAFDRSSGHVEKAIFANGCFWCTEAVFSLLKGVRSVLPGYAIGRADGAADIGKATSV